MERLIAETTYLIDLERETGRKQEGPASIFLRNHRDTRLFMTSIIAGEFAAGLSLSDRDRWQLFVRRFRVLPHSEAVSWYYGESYRYLSEQGMLIGSDDLWIAAAARAYSVPILTRNTTHFERVPGIEVVGY